MPKSPPGIRLLRSLLRAGKQQRSMLSGIINGSMLQPKRKRAKKAVQQPSKARTKITASAIEARADARAAPTTAPGKWIASTYCARPLTDALPARRLAYWLYLPNHMPVATARRGSPMIVMLHGCHQSATQFAQGTRMNQLAEAKGYAVLYPQQSVTAQSQRCWQWYAESTQHGDGDTALLTGLIESVCLQHTIDRQRIYACGISAGAGMAAVLALNHPEMFAAVGLHSGPVFGAARSQIEAMHVMRHGAGAPPEHAVRSLLLRRAALALPDLPPALPPMPALLIQGDDDRVVKPVNQGQIVRQWLYLNGLPADTAARVTTKPAGRSVKRNAHEVSDYLIDSKVLLRVVRIAGLGHAWSGGDASLKFNTASGPDASRMMLEFFRKHRR